MMKTLTRGVCLGMLAMLWTAAPASAADARPPVGSWRDTKNVVTVLLNANGTAFYSGAPGAGVNGTWTWQPTSPVGGIITIHYTTYAGVNVFHNKMYYSFVYIDENTVTISDPYFKTTLKRQ